MKNKDFVMSTLIAAVCYLVATLIFFSQMYLLYDYFNDNFVYMTISGWAYICQGIGMVLFMLLYKKRPSFWYNRFVYAVVLAAFLPAICMPFLIKNGMVLFISVLFVDVLIGISSGFYFSLIACYAGKQLCALSFGTAYTLGSLGTWLISLINVSLMTSPIIILVAIILAAAGIVLIIIYKNLPEDNSYVSLMPESDAKKASPSLILIAILILMSAISTLGSIDYVLASANLTISPIATRGLYGVGLIAAGLIYDKSPKLGGICAVSSLIYPILVIILYSEITNISVLIIISYIFLGFFAVYRAVVFMNHSFKPSIAVAGLALSRFVEAILTMLVSWLGGNNSVWFSIAAGILYIPLIIIFYLYISPGTVPVPLKVAEPSLNERLGAFATKYGLTRREIEIVTYLIKGMSNGEIAAEIHVSENTVHFHIANIFKKTGMHDRNEVARSI